MLECLNYDKKNAIDVNKLRDLIFPASYGAHVNNENVQVLPIELLIDAINKSIVNCDTNNPHDNDPIAAFQVLKAQLLIQEKQDVDFEYKWEGMCCENCDRYQENGKCDLYGQQDPNTLCSKSYVPKEASMKVQKKWKDYVDRVSQPGGF